MINLLENIIDYYSEEEFLKADGFDDAVIGVELNSMRLIYSMTRCIEILVEEGMSVEDALDHFHYNVSSAYVGEKTPIWSDDMYY